MVKEFIELKRSSIEQLCIVATGEPITPITSFKPVVIRCSPYNSKQETKEYLCRMNPSSRVNAYEIGRGITVEEEGKIMRRDYAVTFFEIPEHAYKESLNHPDKDEKELNLREF